MGQQQRKRSAKNGSLAHDVRRRDLIDATLTVIAEDGLSKVTLAKVAGLAGLTAGSVNFHFDSKEALLLETLRQVTEEFGRAMDGAMAADPGDPVVKLGRMVETAFDPEIAEHRKAAVWYAFLAEARTRDEYLAICGERDRRYADNVRSLFRDLVDQSGRPDMDGGALASAFLGLIDTLWQELLFDAKRFDREEAKRRCFAFLASVLPDQFARPDLDRSLEEDMREVPIEDGLTYTFPAWIYGDDGFFALEAEHIFKSSWQIVCHQNEVAEPGQYVTFDMLGERAFVIRDGQGVVRAFHNVCPHRAHELVSGRSGDCKGAIQCPYHGWNFHLDGGLKGVSAPDTFAKFDKSRFDLSPVDVEIWKGFVFIRFRSEGPSIAERMAPFAEEFSHYRTEDMVPHGEAWVEEQPVDWKNAVENYVEDYHFPVGHEGLAALMNKEYDREVDVERGIMRLSHSMRDAAPKFWSGRHYHALLPDYDHLPEKMRRRWSYFGLFPSVYFDMYPESMDFFQVLPVGPGRLRLRSQAYVHPNLSRQDKVALYLSTRINVEVQDEDNNLTQAVQRGMGTGAYKRGILSDKEVVVKGLQDWIRNRLPVADLPDAPAHIAKRNAAMKNTKPKAAPVLAAE